MTRLAVAEWVRQKISTVRHPRSNGSMKAKSAAVATRSRLPARIDSFEKDLCSLNN